MAAQRQRFAVATREQLFEGGVGEDGLVRPLQTVTVDGVQMSESVPTLGVALDTVDSDRMGGVLVNPQ